MSIDIESYVKRFAIAQFSDNYECYEKINGLLNDEQSEMNGDALKAAIMLSAIHAYKDLQLRTISGIAKDDENRKGKCINIIVRILTAYFNDATFEKNQDNWDKWHEESCNIFCEVFEGNSDNKDIKEQKFGKAQKMINMTFKYLYCFDALRKLDNGEYFKFCHMPLDKYTFEIWFKGEVLSWHNEKNSSPIYKSKICVWSKLKNSSDNSYYWVQREIRSYLESESNTEYRDEKDEKLSPFKAEFYIWENEKAKVELKELQKITEEIAVADCKIRCLLESSKDIDLEMITQDTLQKKLFDDVNYKNCDEDLKKFIENFFKPEEIK